MTIAFPVWVLVVSGLLLARSGLFEELRDHRDLRARAWQPRRHALHRWLVATEQLAPGRRPIIRRTPGSGPLPIGGALMAAEMNVCATLPKQ